MKGDKKFLQLGLRRKGRIVKNEQYDITKLVYGVFDEYELKEIKDIEQLTFWNRLNMKKCKDIMDKTQHKGFNMGYGMALRDIVEYFKQLIDKDEFGKKKK